MRFLQRLNSNIFIFFLLLLFFGGQSSRGDSLTPAHRFFPNKELYSCNKNNCLSLEEVMEKVKGESYITREKAEELYRARQMIRVRLGTILPNFSYNTILGGVALGLGDYRDGATGIISSFLGFIFPSNWFRFKESKLFYQAEKYSFLTIQSNQINLVENLYLMVHREIINQKIYLSYLKKLESLLLAIKDRERNGEANPQDVAFLQVIQSELRANAIRLKNILREILPLLSHTIANEPSANWENFMIAPLALPNLEDKSPLAVANYYQTIIDRSLELKTLKYLKHAAHYARKARKFDFFSPAAGPENSLGFGYASSLRIAKSEIKTIAIKIEEEKSRSMKAIYQTVNEYNSALELFNASSEGQHSLQIISDGLNDDFLVTGTIDGEKWAQTLVKSLMFDLYHNYALHSYLMAKANLQRLLREGKFYDHLEDRVPRNSRSRFRNVNRLIEKEDRVIEEDMAKGKLPDIEIF